MKIKSDIKSERIRFMKRTVSIILALVIICLVPSAALAASGKCDCGTTPVVFVPGFGESLYLNPESDSRVSAFPPEKDAIMSAVPDIIKAVAAVLVSGNYDSFGDYAMDAADKMLGDMACNPDGTSKKNVGIMPKEMPSADAHKITNYNFAGVSEEPCGEYTYFYDWRLDPIDNAKGLKTFIDKVKDITGHDEIVLSCHSQGNTVVASYLHLYGSSGIKKLVFLSPAYKGLSLIGCLLNREISVSGKSDELSEYIKGIMGYDNAKAQLIGAVIDALSDMGVVDALLDFVQKILDSQFDRILDEFLIDAMGTMPGVWSFVPDEYYESAKSKTFKGNSEYDALIKKIDYYHYNVQNRVEELIHSAKSSGTAVVIAMGYDISTIPVTTARETHSDLLIDTGYMSLGAVCSDIGKTLGEGYEQRNTACGHNHISPDLTIDASTCEFPEYTWFFRGNGHNTFDAPYLEFLKWAILFDGQPTVHSSERYPQFMQTKEGELVPVDGPRAAESRGNLEIIITCALSLIKDSFKSSKH